MENLPQKQSKKETLTTLEGELKKAIKKEGGDYNMQDVLKIDNVLASLEENAEDEPKFKKALNGVKLADKLNSNTLGKIVYQNFKKIQPNKGKEFVNQIPNEYAFEATLESGFDTFVAWNKERGTFYIESKRGLDKIIQEINRINPNSDMSTLLDKNNPNQIIGQINNITEEEFKKIIL